MAKNRDKQKENRRAGAREEYLSSKTEWGINDPVPQSAIANIIEQNRAS